MKILITGGFGFIGSNLANYFIENGHDVIILSRSFKPDKIKYDNYSFILKDICDITKDDVDGVDVLYHCASTVHNNSIFFEPYIDVDVNLKGTISVLEACKHSATKIIYTSSFFAERTVGLYNITKLCAENICRTYNDVYDTDVVIARFTNVFGVGESGLNENKGFFNRLIYLAVENKEIFTLYSHGEMKRDYIYVSDVVSALDVLKDSGVSGEIYYVGRGESVKFKELVDIVCTKTGYEKVASFDGPVTDFECDVTPLKDLGWEPTMSLSDGIQLVIDDYRRNYE